MEFGHPVGVCYLILALWWANFSVVSLMSLKKAR
jgi:hypothetical protein